MYNADPGAIQRIAIGRMAMAWRMASLQFAFNGGHKALHRSLNACAEFHFLNGIALHEESVRGPLSRMKEGEEHLGLFLHERPHLVERPGCAFLAGSLNDCMRD